MKKLVTGSLVFLAGVASAPLPVSPSQMPGHTTADYRQDPRLQTLRNFFDRCECPAASLSETFLEAADSYELDWRLLPSLSYVETTGGKSVRNNNLFGWDSGKAEFPSLKAGIHTVGYRLANSNLYRDKSLDELLATYNQDVDYGRKVKSVMRRIAPSD
jgi:hypothetical protein